MGLTRWAWRLCGLCGCRFVRLDPTYLPGTVTANFCTDCIQAGRLLARV